MIEYRVPATSANLGIGFDALGIALDIYNTYFIEQSEHYLFEGFMENMNEEDNLFLRAYLASCEYKKKKPNPFHAILKSDIPVSRGLGSSSAVIVGGIFAYQLLYDDSLSKEEMLKIATDIEGHPDNAAPCIYGGLCVNHNGITLKKEVSDKWYFKVLIPDYEVKTSEARKVIKKELSIADAVNNISAGIIAMDALENFNTENIKVIMDDRIHEPYRKALIKDFENCKKEAMDKGASAFLISGSGSSMLVIADKEIELNFPSIEIRNVHVDNKGATCRKN